METKQSESSKSTGVKFEEAMLLVLEGFSVRRACLKTGISEPTFYIYRRKAQMEKGVDLRPSDPLVLANSEESARTDKGSIADSSTSNQN